MAVPDNIRSNLHALSASSLSIPLLRSVVRCIRSCQCPRPLTSSTAPPIAHARPLAQLSREMCSHVSMPTPFDIVNRTSNSTFSILWEAPSVVDDSPGTHWYLLHRCGCSNFNNHICFAREKKFISGELSFLICMRDHLGGRHFGNNLPKGRKLGIRSSLQHILHVYS
jgi:hypothetical protein